MSDTPAQTNTDVIVWLLCVVVAAVALGLAWLFDRWRCERAATVLTGIGFFATVGWILVGIGIAMAPR